MCAILRPRPGTQEATVSRSLRMLRASGGGHRAQAGAVGVLPARGLARADASGPDPSTCPTTLAAPRRPVTAVGPSAGDPMSGGHGHAGGAHRWRLQLAFILVAGYFVVELVAGLMSGSLALLSDAGHAGRRRRRPGCGVGRHADRPLAPDNTGRRTFGSYRAEGLRVGAGGVVDAWGLGLHRGGGHRAHRRNRWISSGPC